MVSCFARAHVARVSGCHFIEIFSGKARTAKRASWMGYRAKAVDIAYSPTLDLLRPGGFRPLGCFLMQNHAEFVPRLDPVWLPKLSDCAHCDRVLDVRSCEQWDQ